MRSNKKISKIILVLSLVAVFSFLTILSVNGVNINSGQYQVDNDSSSIIQGKDDGGGGVIDLIIQGKDDGGGGVIDLISLGKDDGGGGVIDQITF